MLHSKKLFCTGTSKLLQNEKQMHWRTCLLSTEQVTYIGLKWLTAALNHCNTNSTVTHLASVNTLHLHMHIGKHCRNSRSSFTARAWWPACLLWGISADAVRPLAWDTVAGARLVWFFGWTSRSARSFVTCRLAIFRAAATYCGSPGPCEGSDVSQSWSLSITLKKDFDDLVTKSARVASHTASPFRSRSTWTLFFGESALQTLVRCRLCEVQTLRSRWTVCRWRMTWLSATFNQKITAATASHASSRTASAEIPQSREAGIMPAL